MFFSWGGKKTVKQRSSGCSYSRMIVDRAVQRVYRQEIIVASHNYEKSTAINPATGQPYKFWFVNNQSHSHGTFESPFNTLEDAQIASGSYDIVYIFPGDGTDKGLDTGITLKHGQQLLGAGIQQSIATKQGNIHIPAQASGLPHLTNTNDPTGLGVQLAAGNNVVAGLNLQDTQGASISGLLSGGITILGDTQYLIKNNLISTSNFGNGINVYGGGDVIISKNTILGNDTGFTYGILVYPVSPLINQGSFIILNNTFVGSNANTALDQGLHVDLFDQSSPISLECTSNVFDWSPLSAANNIGIYIAAMNAAVSVQNNYVNISTSFRSSVEGIHIETNSGTGVLSASLDYNVSLTTPPDPGYRFINNTGNPNKLQLNFGPSNVGTRIGP